MVASPFSPDARLRRSWHRPAVEWEEVACPLCGSRRWSVLLEAPDLAPGGSGLWFAVVRCPSCQLCFTNPRPSAASLAQFYAAGYGASPRIGNWRRSWRRWALPNGPGRLLDLGCRPSAFLGDLQAQGWEVVRAPVLDLGQSPQRTCWRGPALPLPAFLAEWPAGYFDLATLWHALEHAPDPLAVLRAVQRLLRPGGRLLLIVPNLASAAFQWFGPAWKGLDLPRHLTHFTRATLTRLLYTAGFVPGHWRAIRRSSWWRQSAHQARRHFRSRWWHAWAAGKWGAHLLAHYAHWTGRADCLGVLAYRP
jgi:SAM-dependent methyltransferase